MTVQFFMTQLDDYQFDIISEFYNFVHSNKFNVNDLNRERSYSLWALFVHSLSVNDPLLEAVYHPDGGPIYTRVIQLTRISAEMYNPNADLEAIQSGMMRLINTTYSEFWESETAQTALGIALAHMFRRGLGVHEMFEIALKGRNKHFMQNFMYHISHPTVPLHKNGKFLNAFYERYRFGAQYQRFMMEPLYDIPHNKRLLDNIVAVYANSDLVDTLLKTRDPAIVQLHEHFKRNLVSIFTPQKPSP